MTPLRILIVEDKRDIAENIGDFLEVRGHTADYAMDGLVGLHLATTEDYDVIILDLMLPGMDGIVLCSRLRKEARKHTPVIMLTARDTLEDKLTGFDTGADDYLVKPFALQELYARVLALAKRDRCPARPNLTLGPLTLDTTTLKVYRDGEEIELSNTCLSILKHLLEVAPQVVSRKELEKALWGDNPPGTDSLRTHMYLLRQKVDKPFDVPLIHTIHGIGYRMEEPT